MCDVITVATWEINCESNLVVVMKKDFLALSRLNITYSLEIEDICSCVRLCSIEHVCVFVALKVNILVWVRQLNEYTYLINVLNVQIHNFTEKKIWWRMIMWHKVHILTCSDLIMVHSSFLFFYFLFQSNIREQKLTKKQITTSAVLRSIPCLSSPPISLGLTFTHHLIYFFPSVARQQTGRASLGDVKTTGRACRKKHHTDVL